MQFLQPINEIHDFLFSFLQRLIRIVTGEILDFYQTVNEFYDIFPQPIDKIRNFFQWPIDKICNFFQRAIDKICNFFPPRNQQNLQIFFLRLMYKIRDCFSGVSVKMCCFFPWQIGEIQDFFSVMDGRNSRLFFCDWCTNSWFFFQGAIVEITNFLMSDWWNKIFFSRLTAKIHNFLRRPIDKIHNSWISGDVGIDGLCMLQVNPLHATGYALLS